MKRLDRIRAVLNGDASINPSDVYAESLELSADLHELARASRDVVASRDPEWADANVSTDTAIETLDAALAKFA